MFSQHKQEPSRIVSPERKTRSDITEDIIIISLPTKSNPRNGHQRQLAPTWDEFPGIGSMDLFIDGHPFRIHPNVPKEITKQIRKLHNRNAKYEEIPEHLKAYETEKEDRKVEMARDLEEHRRWRKAFNEKNLREMKEAYRRKKEASKDDPPQPRNEYPGIPSVAPDVIGLPDGHVFRIKYNVPEEHKQQLWELFDREAKYEVFPEHLKAYETEFDTEEEEARLVEENRRKDKAFNDKNLREMKEAYWRKKEASKEKENTSKQ